MPNKSCYAVALERADEFRDAGWRVFVGQNRIKISTDGVVFSVAHGDSCPTIRARTKNGGFSVLDTGVLHSELWMPEQKIDIAWNHAQAISEIVPGKPKWARQKKHLREPYGFMDLEMVCEDGWYEMFKGIRKCRVVDILAIGDDLKLIPAKEPGQDPWFLIDCISEQGKRFRVLTNGYHYYPVTDANRVTENLGELPDPEGLTSMDKAMLRRSIDVFNESLA